jgi:GABA(A) receptor-associated protein
MTIESVKEYDQLYTFEQRQVEANKILAKYPDRIPVFVQKDIKSNIPDIDKFKYLVPLDLTMGQFVYVIRKRLVNFGPEKAIFVFANNSIPPTSMLMSNVYDKFKSKDGYLRIIYSAENTFG